GAARCDAASFSIGTKGFVGVGEGPTLYNDLQDFWQYDPVLNQWTQKATFPGIARDEPVYLSIGNKGYIGVGRNGSTTFFNDFWEYTPDSTTGIEEISTFNFNFQISPNPVKELLVICLTDLYLPGSNGNEKLDVTITDARGKKVYKQEQKPDNGQVTIDMHNLAKGIYLAELSNAKPKPVKKFVKD